MKDIPSIKGAYYIARLIDEGEHEHQDFKFAISDARKIARSISAFANNDGGRLLIGVKDNGVIAGVRNEEDIYVVEQAAEMYCRPRIDLRVTAFTTSPGTIVIRVEIPRAESRPVQAQEPDGRWRAYYRVADENIVAHPLMVRGWRRRGTTSGELVNMSHHSSALLELIDRQGHASVADFIREAHISQSVADETVASLYALDVIDFRYIGTSFRLVRHS